MARSRLQRKASLATDDTVQTAVGVPGPAQQHKPDLASFLDEERKTLREHFQVRPLTAEERRVSKDVRWALQDGTVQAEYQGQVVVPYDGRIVAHGHHAATVLAEAARVTGRRVEELPLVNVLDPLVELAH